MASRDIAGIVGVRGFLDTASTARILDFLSIPRTHWQRIMEEVAVESVKAFYLLHRARCTALNHSLRLSSHQITQGPARRKVSRSLHGSFDTGDPGRSCGGKKRRRSGEDTADTRRRWKRMACGMRRSFGGDTRAAPLLMAKKRTEGKRG